MGGNQGRAGHAVPLIQVDAKTPDEVYWQNPGPARLVRPYDLRLIVNAFHHILDAKLSDQQGYPFEPIKRLP